MGANSSHHHHKRVLSEALATGNVGTVDQVVEEHPEFFSSRLDKDQGNNPMHVAVIMRNHAILQHLVSYASGSRPPAQDPQAHHGVGAAAASEHRAGEHGREAPSAHDCLPSVHLGSVHPAGGSSSNAATAASPAGLSSAVQQAAMKALDHGRAKDGATPLMLACELGDEESVRCVGTSDRLHLD